MSTATGSSMGDSVALSTVRTGQDSSKNPVAVVVQYVNGTCNLQQRDPLLAGQVYSTTKSKQLCFNHHNHSNLHLLPSPLSCKIHLKALDTFIKSTYSFSHFIFLS